MRMVRVAFVAAALAATWFWAITVSATAQPRQVKVGQLTCSLSAGVGLVVGSQRNVNCIFKGQPGEPDEQYTGTMTRIGLDLGVTSGGVIVWTVFADTNRYAGMLAGKYGGPTAEVS